MSFWSDCLALFVLSCLICVCYSPHALHKLPLTNFQSPGLCLFNNDRIERCNSRFFTISSLHREPSPTRTLRWPENNRVQITCDTLSAYHVQRVVLPATWYEGTAQLLSLTDFKSHLYELYFIGGTINRWRRGGNRSTRRKPMATSFRKCHILKPEDSSPKRDSNLHNSIGGRLGKQTC